MPFYRLPDPPEDVVRDVPDLPPEEPVRGVGEPLRAEILIEEIGDQRGDPGGGMDPVGDVGHGVLLRGGLRPVGGPHPGADFAVKPAHPVVEPSQAERQEGHVEHVVAVEPFFQGQVEKLLPLDPHLFPEPTEVFFHQLRGENIVPRGHGGVGGESRIAPNHLRGLAEGHPVILHEEAGPFQSEEDGVPFIHVPGGGEEVQGPEDPDPADPQDDLLADPVLPVPAVKLIGDQPVLRGVLGNVRVQEIKDRPSHPGLPDPDPDLPPGHVHGNDKILSLGILERGDGEVLEVDGGVEGMLISMLVDLLDEIPLPVEEPHGDEGKADVAGRLAVVPREDPQPPRIDGEGFVEGVLRREIGEGLLPPLGVSLGEPGVFIGQIEIIGGHHLVVLEEIRTVGGDGVDLLLAHFPEELDRVMPDPQPEVRIDPVEKPDGLRVPTEPEVVG